MRTIISMGLLLLIAAAVWASGGTTDPRQQRSAVLSRMQPGSDLEMAQSVDSGRTSGGFAAAAPLASQPRAHRPPAPSSPDTPSVWGLADAFSARYGLDDPAVLRALIEAESQGDPHAVHRTAKEWSVGLLQVNLLGGRGTGHSEAELLDPEANLALSMPEIVAAYRQARAEGYVGAALTVRVAERAQRPDPATLERYAAAYAATTTVQAAMVRTALGPAGAGQTE